MPEFRAPRVRMPHVSLPGRSRGAKKPTPSKAETEEQAPAGNGAKPDATEEAAKPATTATKPPEAKAPEPNLQERMQGMQGWMAEIERKQGRTTYFGAAGLLIAILVGGAALYFGLTTKSDSATKSDVDALTRKVDALQAAATKNSKDTQNALNSSVAQLQATIAALQKQAAQNSANIATLQAQATSGAFGKGGAAAGTGLTPTTTTTPGATPGGTGKNP